MSEKLLKKHLKDNLSRHGHVSLIESHETSSGIPDVNFCLAGIEGHIEVKFCHSKKGFKLRQSQMIWFRERMRSRGNAWVFARNIFNADEYTLIPGEHVRHIYGHSSPKIWREQATNIWTGSMNWEELFWVITQKDTIPVKSVSA